MAAILNIGALLKRQTSAKAAFLFGGGGGGGGVRERAKTDSPQDAKATTSRDTGANRSSCRALDVCQTDGANLRAWMNQAFVSDAVLCSINTPIDAYGNTPLHLAVAHRDHTLALLLLVKGGALPDVPNRAGITPVILARRLGFRNIVRLLVTFGAVLPAAEDKDGTGQFAKLARKRVARAGVAKGATGATALIMQKRRERVLHRSDRRRAESVPVDRITNADDMSPRPPAGHGPASISALQREALAELGQQTSSDSVDRPMPDAASDAWTAVVRQLPLAIPSSRTLTATQAAWIGSAATTASSAAFPPTGVSLPRDRTFPFPPSSGNARDAAGCTALMKAARRGHTAVVSHFLASRDTAVDARDPAGLTALTWACLGGHTDVAKALVLTADACVDGAVPVDPLCPWRAPPPPLLTPLVAAAFAGAAEAVDFLIRRGCDVDRRAGPYPGKSALMVAACMRRLPVVRLLLAAGATVDDSPLDWLRDGVVKLKRFALDGRLWPGDGRADSGGSRLELLARGFGWKEMLETFSPHDLNQSLSKGNLEYSIDLNIDFPERGTELDQLSLQLFTCVLQLVLAADKQIKHHYVLIAARAIHRSEELIQSIQSIFRPIGDSDDGDAAHDVGGSPDNWPPHPVSPHYSCPASNRLGDTSFFARSELLRRIKARVRVLTIDLQEDLAFATKIACGVWPPANAVTDMIRAGAALAKAGRELVLLVNALGVYPTLDKPLELQLQPYEETLYEPDPSLSDSDDETEPVLPRPNLLTFEQYKRYDDIRSIEQLSKSYESPPRCPDSDPADASLDLELFRQLEPRLRSFVAAVADLKRANPTATAATPPAGTGATAASPAFNIESATAAIQDRAESILSLIQNSELVCEFAEITEALVAASETGGGFGGGQEQEHQDQQQQERPPTAAAAAAALFDHLAMTEDDARALEATGAALLRLDGQAFPALLVPLLASVADGVRASAARVAELGRLAAAAAAVAAVGPGTSSPSHADAAAVAQRAVLEACPPCVVAVKSVYLLARHMSCKARLLLLAEDAVAKGEWRRRHAQNAKVKAIFQVWQRQEEDHGDAERDEQLLADGSEVLTAEELLAIQFDESADGLVMDETNQLLKGGRLTKILELMTSHRKLDHQLMAGILMTHHSFTTSLDLLKRLIRRYERIQPPANLSERLLLAWLRMKARPIQLNVLTVLLHWVNTQFEDDFERNDELLDNLRSFVRRIVVLDFPSVGKELLACIERKMHGFAETTAAVPAVEQPKSSTSQAKHHNSLNPLTHFPTFSLPSPSSLPHLLTGAGPTSTSSASASTPSSPRPAAPRPFATPFSPSAAVADLAAHLLAHPHSIFDLHATELARQLALLDFEMFGRVRPAECLEQIWGAKLARERGRRTGAGGAAAVAVGRRGDAEDGEAAAARSTGISRMIHQTNSLTMWIASCIITCETPKARALAVKFFVQCAVKCRDMRNYNAVTGIVASLSMAPISRLRKTWQMLKTKWPAVHDSFERLSALVSPKGQYANYRREIKDLKPPVVPFLGVYLTDLTFIELGNPDFLPPPHHHTLAASSRGHSSSCSTAPTAPADANALLPPPPPPVLPPTAATTHAAAPHLNYDKRRKVYHVVREIQRFQQAGGYHYAPVEPIRSFLLAVGDAGAAAAGVAGAAGMARARVLSEDEMYERSLAVEPREVEDDGDDTVEEEEEADGAEDAEATLAPLPPPATRKELDAGGGGELGPVVEESKATIGE
ncbi:hypothetical protein DFJ73DRAFT_799339 [Zopfochytrium polystomum]|nr:hypothetical protein DFJ73DRAFT_799339 [Zopfochytrium polystomum]